MERDEGEEEHEKQECDRVATRVGSRTQRGI
jgi:hypothetical protein